MENEASDIFKNTIIKKNIPLPDCYPTYSSPKFRRKNHPNFQRLFYCWPMINLPKTARPRMGPPPPKGNHGPQSVAHIPYQPKISVYASTTWYQNNCA